MFVPATVAVKVNVWPTTTVLLGAVTVTLRRLDGGAVLLLPEQPLKNKTIGKKNSPMVARVICSLGGTNLSKLAWARAGIAAHVVLVSKKCRGV